MQSMVLASSKTEKEIEKRHREKVRQERQARKRQREETKRAKRQRRANRLRGRGLDPNELQQQKSQAQWAKNQNVATIAKKEAHPCFVPSTKKDCLDGEEDVNQIESSTVALPLLRIVVAGCGGRHANRCLLPILYSLVEHHNRTTTLQTKRSPFNNGKQLYFMQVSALCASSPGCSSALETLKLQQQQQQHNRRLRKDGSEEAPAVVKDKVECYETIESYIQATTKNNATIDPSIQKTVDVCLLSLPSLKIADAIGLCLRSNKFVLSEKPASATSSQSMSLWDCFINTQNHHHPNAWSVLENWDYKPTLSHFFLAMHTETVRQNQPPTFYDFCWLQHFFETIHHEHDEKLSWRSITSSNYRNGWGINRDLGVHPIRILRRLFGEITQIEDCRHEERFRNVSTSSSSSSSSDLLVVDTSATFRHDSVSQLRGSFTLENYGVIKTEPSIKDNDCNSSVELPQPMACLIVRYGSSLALVWDIPKAAIYRIEGPIVFDKPPSSLSSTTTSTTATTREFLNAIRNTTLNINSATVLENDGSIVTLLHKNENDSWMTGGMKECLHDALEFVATQAFHDTNNDHDNETIVSYETPRCCPEEALRDVAIIDAMKDAAQGVGCDETKNWLTPLSRSVENQLDRHGAENISKSEGRQNCGVASTEHYRPQYGIPPLIQKQKEENNVNENCDDNNENLLKSTRLWNSTRVKLFCPWSVANVASRNDIVEIILAAYASMPNVPTVRAMGCCHSTHLLDNSINIDDDVKSNTNSKARGVWMISTTFLNRILDFRRFQNSEQNVPKVNMPSNNPLSDNGSGRNGGGALVRVEVGMTLSQLHHILEQQQQCDSSPSKEDNKGSSSCYYTLPSLPILLQQTIGGALSTGSHGSSLRHGTVSDCVVAIRLVSFKGQILTVVPDEYDEWEGLKQIVQHDDNDIVKSDELLKVLRCGLGQRGFLVDVVLRLTSAPSLIRSEVPISMRCLNESSRKMQDLALRSEHCWIQWKLPSAIPTDGDDSRGKAVAVVLTDPCSSLYSDAFEGNEALINIKNEAKKNYPFEAIPPAKLYNGRNWFPPGAHMRQLYSTSRKRGLGEHKRTMQLSFPFSSLPIAMKALYDLSQEHSDEFALRLLEFKFLRSSTLTLMAPNSVISSSSETSQLVAAVNFWWDTSSDAIFEMIASQFLSCLPDGRARIHYGKYVPDSWMLHHRNDELTQTFRTIHFVDDRGILSKPLSRPPRQPILSVLLPVYNAMPWLPLALRDVLKQEVCGNAVEILAGDDCATDGSFEFLVEVALALGDNGSVEEVTDTTTTVLTAEEARARIQKRRHFFVQNKLDEGNEDMNEKSKSINPANFLPKRDSAELPKSCIPSSETVIAERQWTVQDVVSCACRRNRLRVLVLKDDINRGMGAVMSTCLSMSCGHYIGHMESDDERPNAHSYEVMLQYLRSHPELDGVSSQTKCIGWDSPGMARYVQWQNKLDTPRSMAEARFIEIPTLQQTAIFGRHAVWIATTSDNAASDSGQYRDDAMWAVDMHYWLAYFHWGLSCGKMSEVFFHWRQHPGQQTRSHGRLSVENLRKCKCYFLCHDKGGYSPLGRFLYGPSRQQKTKKHQVVRIEVWSTGKTLDGWVEDLRSELRFRKKDEFVNLVAVDWKPGWPIVQSSNLSCAGASGSDALASSLLSSDCKMVAAMEQKQLRVRLFAYGMEKARKQIREQLGSDWSDERDWFVA